MHYNGIVDGTISARLRQLASEGRTVRAVREALTAEGFDLRKVSDIAILKEIRNEPVLGTSREERPRK